MEYITASSVGWFIALPDIQLSSLVTTKAGIAMPRAEMSLSSPRTLSWMTGDIENVRGSEHGDKSPGRAAKITLPATAGTTSWTGLAGSDVVRGGAGNDLLVGGAGADKMYGGPGNDIYEVDDIADVVTELHNEGRDTVREDFNQHRSLY